MIEDLMEEKMRVERNASWLEKNDCLFMRMSEQIILVLCYMKKINQTREMRLKTVDAS